jgi:hypothetical protein
MVIYFQSKLCHIFELITVNLLPISFFFSSNDYKLERNEIGFSSIPSENDTWNINLFKNMLNVWIYLNKQTKSDGKISVILLMIVFGS